jgi:hypothetical protein
MNPPVSPERVLLRQADGEPRDAADRRRPARLAPLAGVVPPGGELAVPGQQRRGRHRKAPVQRCRGMNRVSAANQARSPGSYRTQPAFRRSTAFWCRSTSNSASLAWSPRSIGATRPKDQRIGRQAILGSTRPANHRSGRPAAAAAGQTTRSSIRAARVHGQVIHHPRPHIMILKRPCAGPWRLPSWGDL